MVPETVYTYGIVFSVPFFTSCELKQWAWEPFFTDWLQWQNLKPLWVQETSTMMKQKTDLQTYYFLFIIFFLLKWDFLWNHLVTQNINMFLPTHPPKTSDWRFARQNGSSSLGYLLLFWRPPKITQPSFVLSATGSFSFPTRMSLYKWRTGLSAPINIEMSQSTSILLKSMSVKWLCECFALCKLITSFRW